MFVKDARTNVIINTDDNQYKSVLNSREISKRNKMLCKEMDALKQELTDIKELLQKVLNK